MPAPLARFLPVVHNSSWPTRVQFIRRQVRVKFGTATFSYEVEEGWGELPPGWDLVEVPGLAVDSQDRVYASNRGEHPMVVFDRNGRFLTSWGEGIFSRAHG